MYSFTISPDYERPTYRVLFLKLVLMKNSLCIPRHFIDILHSPSPYTFNRYAAGG